METYTSFVVKRTDGAMVNIRYEPVKTIRSALRFNNEEDFQTFITGYYKPDNPEEYYLQPIKTSYEEIEIDV
jgi:hypothetical protein